MERDLYEYLGKEKALAAFEEISRKTRPDAQIEFASSRLDAANNIAAISCKSKDPKCHFGTSLQQVSADGRKGVWRIVGTVVGVHGCQPQTQKSGRQAAVTADGSVKLKPQLDKPRDEARTPQEVKMALLRILLLGPRGVLATSLTSLIMH